jgi:hypothetical protein
MKICGNDLMHSRAIMKIFGDVLVCSRDRPRGEYTSSEMFAKRYNSKVVTSFAQLYRKL